MAVDRCHGHLPVIRARELSEIRWIEGNDNLGDAMTKAKPNKAPQTLMEMNELRVKVVGWVDRLGQEEDVGKEEEKGSNWR